MNRGLLWPNPHRPPSCTHSVPTAPFLPFAVNAIKRSQPSPAKSISRSPKRLTPVWISIWAGYFIRATRTPRKTDGSWRGWRPHSMQGATPTSGRRRYFTNRKPVIASPAEHAANRPKQYQRVELVEQMRFTRLELY
jgi:hypothetical protein